MTKATPETLSIGKIISKRRKEMNLSQGKLADKVGISKTILGDYERGTFRQIPEDRLEKINSVLNLNIENPEYHDPYDLMGRKFGKLTVIEYLGVRGKNHRYWKCKCECGNIIEARGSHLLHGDIKSCGCLREITGTKNAIEKNKGAIRYKHGLSRSRIYYTYYSMLKRCNLKSCKSYPRYGGRGISVCSEWSDKEQGFKNFYNWAMNNGYSDNLSIDRINVDGDYEPSNCRWVDNKKQSNNRTNTVYITYNGETHSASEWSDITGIKYQTIKNRLKRGFSANKILSNYDFRADEGLTRYGKKKEAD